MAGKIGSDFYDTASLYEACRKEAKNLDHEQREALASQLEESFPVLKQEFYPNTKNCDLAQNFFKDPKFRLEMRDKFNEWSQREPSIEEVAVRKRRFSSMCREFEEACLNPVFVQFRKAKEGFKGKILERITQGDSLEDIQKDLSSLEIAQRKTMAWYQQFKPQEEGKSPRDEPVEGTSAYY